MLTSLIVLRKLLDFEPLQTQLIQGPKFYKGPKDCCYTLIKLTGTN